VKEAIITINGVTLTDTQALVIRIAVVGHDWFCGRSKEDRATQRSYEARADEILKK